MSRPVTTDRSEPAAVHPFELCDGVLGLFTGRAGGVSAGPFGTLNLGLSVGDDPGAVARNRAVLLRSIGPGPVRLAWMRQVHGTAVQQIDVPEPGAGHAAGTYGRCEIGPADSAAPDGGPPGGVADAIFTGSPGVALGALVADCAPVLIADPGARLVGVAHAGREGMAAGVVPALAAAMVMAGGRADRMVAAIGPAICGECYEVPVAMRDRVAADVPESACVTRAGTAGIDLRAGLRAQLAGLGVIQAGGDARCTAESADLYSYRRDGVTGRFAGLIWLAP